MLACVSLAASLGCEAGAFTCASDAQCGAMGQCEASGWCSFPDESCPGMRRYGSHSGGGLGGVCVPEDGDVGTGVDGTSTSSATLTSAMEASSEPPIVTSDASETTTTTTDPSAETSSPGSSSGDEEVDPTLLLWLEFDDPEAPWADRGEHGHDASCIPESCPMLEMAPLSTAARFDGIDDSLLVDGEAFAMDEAFTLAVWVAADEPGTDIYQDVLTRAWGRTFENSWGIGFPEMVGTVRFVVHDGEGQVVVGDVEWPAEGGWHHVAGTYDGAVARFYFDGLAVSEIEVSAIAYDEHPVVVGADTEAGEVVGFFAGAVDDVRVYTRALAEDEVAALADSG
jgi:hypothetical protein